jgi:predicted amidohydrolase YtcJ
MAYVIHNARIHTLNPDQPIANALAIDGESIQAVGSDTDICSVYGSAKIYNAEGRTIIPGLTDAHIHLETYALGLQKVDCETSSRAECLERVAERARNSPAGAWILGHGWNQNSWPEGFGDPQELDAYSPHNPVYLTAKSLHAGWANSAALRLAGIHAQTADPARGRLGRTPDGSPNGILFECAMDLVAQVVPEASIAQVEQAILKAQSLLLQMGLTGVHDFDRRRCFTALQHLHQQDQLHLRVSKSIPLEDLSHAVQLGLRTGFGDTMLCIGPVKGFADGALGPHTAAMFSPYEDDPQNSGILMLDAEELVEHGREAVCAGLSLAIHAIGDRAVHEVLKAFSQLRAYEAAQFPAPSERLRHRIEHVQLIHPADRARLAELGVIASMQPIHATSDMLMADKFWGERAALSYAWRTKLDHGAILAFGSDAPVESPNPFWGLYAAVTRRRADGSPGPEGWYPAQRLDRFEALQGFTSGPAYATGMEKRLGKLAPGFLADLIILDRDIFDCDADQIKDIRPAATMLGGAWVWGQ